MCKPKYSFLKQNKADLRALLHASPSSSTLQQQLLQRIPDPTMCLEVTEQSLDQHTSLATSHFLANYLTTHFYGQLTAVRHREIQALYVGSKVRRKRRCWEGLPEGEIVSLALLQNLPFQWLFCQAPAISGLCYMKSLPQQPTVSQMSLLDLSFSSRPALVVNSTWSS